MTGSDGVCCSYPGTLRGMPSIHFPIHTAVVIACKMLADTFRRHCLDRSKLRQGRENARTVPSVQRVSLFLYGVGDRFWLEVAGDREVGPRAP